MFDVITPKIMILNKLCYVIIFTKNQKSTVVDFSFLKNLKNVRKTDVF